VFADRQVKIVKVDLSYVGSYSGQIFLDIAGVD